MKQKLLLAMFLMLIGIGEFETAAQSLVVKTKDGTEYFKSLSSLQKFSFSGNNLMLNYKSSQTETYSLATISKLYFSTITGIKTATTKGSMSIFPNPAENLIYFQNMQEETHSVLICRMDGKLIFNKQISTTDKSVNISSLRKGLYLIKINNQVFKLIKL